MTTAGPADAPIPSVVYHYTSGIGLMGICESSTIRASSIEFLNDAQEMRLAISIASGILSAPRGELARVPQRILESQAEYFSRVPGLGNFFVASFSEEADSLSQWRAYGARQPGGSYALGISGESLAKTAAEQEWQFVRCVYQREDQMAVMGQILDQWANEQILTRSGSEINSMSTDDDAVRCIVNYVGFVGSWFKHPSFSDEREWRLISPIIWINDPAIQMRASETLVPYVNFNLPKTDDRLSVKRLVVGPGERVEQREQAASMLFGRYDVSWEMMTRSETPYRGLVLAGHRC